MKTIIPKRLFSLHISMDEIEPLIWRRLLTDSSTTLFELHNYIQLIFYNWRNYHLYLFKKGGVDFEQRNYRRPICMDGENSAPPEDVGGVHGFEVFREIISDPNHPQYHEYRTWAGRSYDPGKFDLKKANQRLGVRKNYIFEYNLGIDVPSYTPRMI